MPYFLLLACIFLASCKSSDQNIVFESGQLKILKVSQHCYIHESYLQIDGYGSFPCNGLLIMDGGEVIVVDTPADSNASKILLDWISGFDQHKTKALIVNHFHKDCTAGLEVFDRARIESYAHQLTDSILSARQGMRTTSVYSDTLVLELDGLQLKTFFPGSGHSPDNTVTWVEKDKLLFGGCLVKCLGGGKGNLEDADIGEWPSTIRRLKREFPDLDIVIPGHGDYGGLELLDYTIELFEK